MNKLFGSSKPKKEEPKPNINAPTLGETSAKVNKRSHKPYDQHFLTLFLTTYRWTPEARSFKRKLTTAIKS